MLAYLEEWILMTEKLDIPFVSQVLYKRQDVFSKFILAI